MWTVKCWWARSLILTSILSLLGINLTKLRLLKSDACGFNEAKVRGLILPLSVSAGGAGVLASCTNTSVTDEAHLSQLALCWQRGNWFFVPITGESSRWVCFENDLWIIGERHRPPAIWGGFCGLRVKKKPAAQKQPPCFCVKVYSFID